MIGILGERAIRVAMMALAIAKFEGWYIPNSIAQRHRNPGNLRPVGASTGFQTFRTDQEGWVALHKQIERNIRRRLTMEEFFCGKPGVYPGYAPAADNNPCRKYAHYVAQQVGIPPDIVIEDWLSSLPS